MHATMKRIDRNWGDPTGWWKVSWQESGESQPVGRTQTVEGRANAEKLIDLIEATPKGVSVTRWAFFEAGIIDLAEPIPPKFIEILDTTLRQENITAEEKVAAIKVAIRHL